TTHPIYKQEVKVLNEWLRVRKDYPGNHSGWLFLSRNGQPLSRQRIYQMMKNLSLVAQLEISAHPHMLRHACGFALANNGVDTRLIQDFLGHRNIQHTVIYTASNDARFREVW
ncbi:TPA: tyrosine-type recombinase/integrase, partial [Klebsiella oxytoca]